MLLALLLPVAPAPAATASSTIPHGSAVGSWVFRPGATLAAPAAPRQTPAGSPWEETAPLTGTLPAGTWRLAASLTTTVPAGRAQGSVLAAVYAVGADGARLLGVPRSDEVLADGTAKAIELSLPLDAVVLRDERILVEWYLAVARAQLVPADAATTLTTGEGSLVLPAAGAPAPLPLLGPTHAAVSDPQDHRLRLTWRAGADARVTGFEVRGGPAGGAVSTLATVAAGADPTHAFVVDGLPNRQPWTFSVVGVTDDGARTAPSNLTHGRALDRTPPDAPGAPTAVPDGTGALAVAWSASTAADLAGYQLERAGTSTGPFVPIARDLVGRTYVDRGLPPQTTWSYRVRSVDDDGLRSEPGPVTTTTSAPAVPTGLRIAATGDATLTIDWNGTSRPLAGYRVERASDGGAFAPVGGLVTGTSYTDSGLSNGGSYRYRVRAEDSRGVGSSWSEPVSGSPRPTPAPLAPTFLTVTDATGGAALEWGASPTRGVVGYQVRRSVGGGAPSDLGPQRTTLSATDRGVAAGTRYEYTVVAVDAAGRRSPPTTAVAFVLQPGAPRDLTVTPAGTTSVDLGWTASTDTTASYEVWRSEGTGSPALIARTDGTRLRDGGLVLETTYRYFVRAVAAGFRASPASDTVEITLRDGPPSAPIVTAVDTTEGGSVEIRWQPPAERDVVAWRIERRVAGDARWDVVAEPPQPLRSHRDGGLTDGVRYEYRLVAVDRGGAESPPSAVTSAVPTDTTPPALAGAPTVRLTIGALAVDWDVAPTAVRYEVHRSTSPAGPFQRIASTSLRALRDTDVQPGATYHYRIVAFDEVGNASAPSPIASGTFRTGASPGSVVPVLPGAEGPPPGGGAGPSQPGVDLPPTTPFDPTRPVFPPGFGGAFGGSGDGVGTDAPARPMEPRPDAGDGSVLAFPPDLGPLRDAVSAGDLPAAVGRVIGEVAGNVPDVARTFSIPLLLVVVILLYLMAQGRIDRDAALLTVDAPAGGDQDDVEFLL